MTQAPGKPSKVAISARRKPLESSGMFGKPSEKLDFLPLGLEILPLFFEVLPCGSRSHLDCATAQKGDSFWFLTPKPLKWPARFQFTRQPFNPPESALSGFAPH